MMDPSDFGIGGPEEYLDAIVNSRDLEEMVTTLEQASVYLVMGLEHFLRAVDAPSWIRTLTQFGREITPGRFCTPATMTLTARVMASVLEYVPGSTRLSRPIVQEMVIFITGVLKKAQELCNNSNVSDLPTLAEECLRILLWTVNDDETGAIWIKTNFVRCAMNCLEWADTRITKQIFLVVCSASRKVVFEPSVAAKGPPAKPPSAMEKKWRAFVASLGSGADVIALEFREQILPRLHEVAEKSAMLYRQSRNSSFAPLWMAKMEGSFEALSLIASRASKCGAAQIVQATTTPAAFQALVQLLAAKLEYHGGIPTAEKDKEGRASILHFLTCLQHFVSVAPLQFRHTMVHTMEAQQLFENILQPSSVDVLHLLDDPFGTVPLSKSSQRNPNSMLPDQEHTATITALMCLIQCVPSLPDVSFGRTGPLSFVAVRSWSWEDDVHSFHYYSPEQWCQIEIALAEGETKASVREGSRSYDVNVAMLKQANGRSLRCSFVPAFFKLVENGQPDVDIELPMNLSDEELTQQEASTLEKLYLKYITMILRFSTQCSVRILKTASMFAATSLLHGAMLANNVPRGPPQASFSSLQSIAEQHFRVSESYPLFCELLVDALTVPEEDAVPHAALALSCLDWLLHNQQSTNGFQFSSLCARFGVPQALHMITHYTSPATFQVSKHATMLLFVFDATGSPLSRTSEANSLTAALQLFRNSSSSFQNVYLSQLVEAIESAERLTNFEFVNAGVAETLLQFLTVPSSGGKTDSLFEETSPQQPPQETPSTGAMALVKDRFLALVSALSNHPLALRVLIKKTISVLPHLCPLPLIQSPLTESAVTPRPLNEALAMLCALSPTMEMCCPRPKTSTSHVDPSTTSPLSGSEYDESDPLYLGLEFPEPIITPPNPQSPFHILCTIADVEAYFHSTDVASLSEPWQRRWECFYEGIGRCRLSETLLSMFYRKAINRQHYSALQEFENCLIRVDAAGQKAALRRREALAATHPAVSSPAKTATPLKQILSRTTTSPGQTPSPIRGQMFSNNRKLNRASVHHSPIASQPIELNTKIKGGSTIRQFGESAATRSRIFPLHYIRDPTSSDGLCCCGSFTATEFHDMESLDLVFIDNSTFAQQPEVKLIFLLYSLFEKSAREKSRYTASWDEHHSMLASLPEQLKMEPEAFLCDDITGLVVRSVQDCAFRLATLPISFALPPWVLYVMNHLPFLLPSTVRQRLAHFINCGARRALSLHFRTVGVSTALRRPDLVVPSEWVALESNSVQMRVLRSRNGNATFGSKFSIRRGVHFFQDSLEALSMSCGVRVPLVLEFVGEKGTGFGPTVQWFTECARELCKVEHGGVWTTAATNPGATHVQVKSEGLYFAKDPHRNDNAADTTQSSPPNVVTTAADDDENDDEDDDADIAQYMRELKLRSTPSRSSSTTGSDYAALKHSREEPMLTLERADACYFLGLLLGRAYHDEQIAPIPLSRMILLWFLRWGLAQSPSDCIQPLTPYHLALVDQDLSKQLLWLLDQSEATLEELQMRFVVPGHDDVEMCVGGAEKVVCHANRGEYVHLVCRHVAYDLVNASLRRMWEGFTDVVASEGLCLLDEAAFETIVLGDSTVGPLWTFNEIRGVLEAAHGYVSESPQIVMLARILADELNPRQQRQFLEFCTGCPRLPVGGIAGVGKITVVRRGENNAGFELDEESARQSLPTVNTCFKYLKLPPYNTVETMKEKLILSIEHAREPFELS